MEGLLRSTITPNADPFAKKDWYDIKAPGTFTVRNAGKTLVSRTAGTKVRRMALGRRSRCVWFWAIAPSSPWSRLHPAFIFVPCTFADCFRAA